MRHKLDAPITNTITNHKTDAQRIAVIILKFEPCGFTIECCVQEMQMDADGMANSVALIRQLF